MDFRDLLREESKLKFGLNTTFYDKVPEREVSRETRELKALVQQYSDENERLKTELNRARYERARQPGFDWIDGKAAMKLLSISKRTLQNWRDNKTLGFSRLNNKLYYRREIDQLMEKNYSGRLGVTP